MYKKDPVNSSAKRKLKFLNVVCGPHYLFKIFWVDLQVLSFHDRRRVFKGHHSDIITSLSHLLHSLKEKMN